MISFFCYNGYMLKRIYIEITNQCNLNCAFCLPHKRKPLSMTTDFFRNVVRQAKHYTPYIYLHVKGEPLLHPEFDEIMTIADEEGMHVQLVTNSTFLNKYADKLLSHPSLRKISFSLQSIEYQKDDPLTLLETILSFCKKASQQDFPYCEIRFWRSDQLEEDRTALCLDYLKAHYDFTPSRNNTNFRIMPHVYVDFDNAFTWPDVQDKENDTTGYCHGAIDQIAILSDGTVVPCCLDQNGEIAFGNLHEASLVEILSSLRYHAMCKGLHNRQLTESFCRKCTFRLRFNK